MEIGPIYPGEKKPITFNFTSEFKNGTLAQVDVSVTQLKGDDPTPAARLDGLPLIQGKYVTQDFSNGVAGSQYLLTATGTDSSSHRHVVHALITVRRPRVA
jgi:hypothetical protein